MTKINLRFTTISFLIFLAAVSRLIPHPPNFSPIAGMALFGATYYSKRYWAFIIPITSMWISDIMLNNIVYSQYFDHFVWFYKGSLFIYGPFGLIVLLGIFTLKKIRISNIIISAILASLIFFIISNFGVWYISGMYPPTKEGLMQCYIAGIPFFKNTLVGDLFYTSILFGIFKLSISKIPQLRKEEG